MLSRASSAGRCGWLALFDYKSAPRKLGTRSPKPRSTSQRHPRAALDAPICPGPVTQPADVADAVVGEPGAIRAKRRFLIRPGLDVVDAKLGVPVWFYPPALPPVLALVLLGSPCCNRPRQRGIAVATKGAAGAVPTEPGDPARVPIDTTGVSLSY